MRKFVCIVTVLLSIVVTVKAQDYEALGKFMKKYSQNWARSYNEQIGQPMPSYHFDKKLNSKALKGKFVVLNFWATWCGPCLMQAPILEQLSEEISEDELKIVKIDVDENPETAQKFGIMSIPTLLFKKDGEVVKQVAGVHTKEQIKAIVAELSYARSSRRRTRP